MWYTTMSAIWFFALLTIANVVVRLALGDRYMMYWRLIMMANLPVMFVLIPYLMLKGIESKGYHFASTIFRLILTIALMAFTIAYLQSLAFAPIGANSGLVIVVVGLVLFVFYAIILLHMKRWVFARYAQLMILNSNNWLTNALQFASAVLWYTFLCLPFDAVDLIKDHAKDVGGLMWLAVYLIVILAVAGLIGAAFLILAGVVRDVVIPG